MPQDPKIYGPYPGSVSRDEGYFSTHLIGAKGASQRLTQVFQASSYEFYWAWPSEKAQGLNSLYNISYYKGAHIGACSSAAWLMCGQPALVKTGILLAEALSFLRSAENLASHAGYSLTETHYCPGNHYSQAKEAQNPDGHNRPGPQPI